MLVSVLNVMASSRTRDWKFSAIHAHVTLQVEGRDGKIPAEKENNVQGKLKETILEAGSLILGFMKWDW